MSELYYDILKAHQERCAAVLAGLGTITQGAVGLPAEVPAGTNVGIPWIDVLVLRAEGGEMRGGAQALVVETTIQVVVVAEEWPLATDLARWVVCLADARLRADIQLAPLFGKVLGTSTNDARAEVGSGPQVVFEHVIRSEIQHHQPQGDIAGFVVTLDAEDDEGGDDRGHATASTTASLVAFGTQLPQAAPHAPSALYANAGPGDTIEVLDQNDAIVATASVTTVPAGIITLPSLLAGVYTLRLNGVRSLYTLTISGVPA